MAMSGVVIPRLAAFAGILPSTMDRLIRDLRANGLAPMGKHGRGQEHGQFEASHLAHVILGFAASLPSGASEAVKDLRPLYAENLQGAFAAGDLAETLGGNLEDEIIRRAHIILSKNSEVLPSNHERWELTLCLNPVMAWESWVTDNKEHRRYYRKIEQINLPHMPHPQDFNAGVRKLTVITTTVLNAAAELCADTASLTNPQHLGAKK
jgi:hypothetical protein